MDTQTAPTAQPFSISQRAASRVAEIIHAQPGAPGPDEIALRVAVLAGGCSGFQYTFRLEREIAADDIIFSRDGTRVVVDPISLDLLAGAELDFADKLMGAHFTVRNPIATSSCGCGTSFSID